MALNFTRLDGHITKLKGALADTSQTEEKLDVMDEAMAARIERLLGSVEESDLESLKGKSIPKRFGKSCEALSKLLGRAKELRAKKNQIAKKLREGKAAQKIAVKSNATTKVIKPKI